MLLFQFSGGKIIKRGAGDVTAYVIQKYHDAGSGSDGTLIRRISNNRRPHRMPIMAVVSDELCPMPNSMDIRLPSRIQHLTFTSPPVAP